ncbi:MAG: hypothetical protein AAF721_16975 [Myxococcota bacterium]
MPDTSRHAWPLLLTLFASCTTDAVDLDDGSGSGPHEDTAGGDDGFDDDGFDDGGVDDGFDDGAVDDSTTGATTMGPATTMTTAVPTASGGWDDDGAADTEWDSDGPWSDSGDWGSTGGYETGGGDTGGEDCIAVDLGSAMGSEVLAGFVDGSDTAALACNPAGPASADVALSWTPPSLGDYTVVVSSEAFDPVLAVRDDDCGSPLFGCNDNCVGTTATLVVSGWETPVQFIVESADGTGGAFSLSIESGATVACQ